MCYKYSLHIYVLIMFCLATTTNLISDMFQVKAKDMFWLYCCRVRIMVKLKIHKYTNIHKVTVQVNQSKSLYFHIQFNSKLTNIKSWTFLVTIIIILFKWYRAITSFRSSDLSTNLHRFMGNSIANRCMCNSLDNIVYV